MAAGYEQVGRHENHQWSPDGPKITAPDALATIRRAIDDDGAVIIERALYCGGGSREWRLFDKFDALLAYLETETFAGDRIAVWSVPSVLRDKDMIVTGKCPDDDGYVPFGGAY